jgi:hypothetical protein
MVIPFNIIAVVCVFTMPNSQHDMNQQMKTGKGEFQKDPCGKPDRGNNFKTPGKAPQNKHLFPPND